MVERTADNRIRTCEWDDIQYKHGNRVGAYATNELNILAQRVKDAHPNAGLEHYDDVQEKVYDKALRGGYDNSDAILEGNVDPDEEDDDEDDYLTKFRAQRKQQMEVEKSKNCFGRIRRIPGEDYVTEITDGSDGHWVVAVLVENGDEGSDALLRVMETTCVRHADVKFVSMIATEAITKFPRKQLPCVLIYHNKLMVKQLTGTDHWGGKRLSPESVDHCLAQFGVIESPDEEEEEDAALRYSKYYSKLNGEK
jgi:hypothetical protein